MGWGGANYPVLTRQRLWLCTLMRSRLPRWVISLETRWVLTQGNELVPGGSGCALAQPCLQQQSSWNKGAKPETLLELGLNSPSCLSAQVKVGLGLLLLCFFQNWAAPTLGSSRRVPAFRMTVVTVAPHFGTASCVRKPWGTDHTGFPDRRKNFKSFRLNYFKPPVIKAGSKPGAHQILLPSALAAVLNVIAR